MFVPLMFGDLTFGVDTLAFNSLKKTFGGTLSQHARIGGQPALQFTGRPARKVTLAGTLFPTRLLSEPETEDGAAKIVGRSDLETLRTMVESGESRWLVSGSGDVFGKFAIESLNEDESAWLEEGTPLRIDFTISLVEDLAEPGEENESSLAVLELNATAREQRAVYASVANFREIRFPLTVFSKRKGRFSFGFSETQIFFTFFMNPIEMRTTCIFNEI